MFSFFASLFGVGFFLLVIFGLVFFYCNRDLFFFSSNISFSFLLHKNCSIALVLLEIDFCYQTVANSDHLLTKSKIKKRIKFRDVTERKEAAGRGQNWYEKKIHVVKMWVLSLSNASETKVSKKRQRSQHLASKQVVILDQCVCVCNFSFFRSIDDERRKCSGALKSVIYSLMVGSCKSYCSMAR